MTSPHENTSACLAVCDEFHQPDRWNFFVCESEYAFEHTMELLVSWYDLY